MNHIYCQRCGKKNEYILHKPESCGKCGKSMTVASVISTRETKNTQNQNRDNFSKFMVNYPESKNQNNDNDTDFEEHDVEYKNRARILASKINPNSFIISSEKSKTVKVSDIFGHILNNRK